MGRGSSSSSGGSRGSSSSGGFSRGSSSRSYRSSSSRSYHYDSTSSSYDYNSNSSNNGSGSSKVGLIIVGVIFLLVSIIAVTSIISNMSNIGKYKSVTATSIKNTYLNGWYYTTYTYEIDNVEYENMSQVGWEEPEILYRNITIYYKIDDPNYITEEKPADLTSSIISLVICSGIGIGTIFIFVKVAKSKKEKEEIEESIKKELTSTEVICRYCGSNYNKDLTSCPNCGANKTKQ